MADVGPLAVATLGLRKVILVEQVVEPVQRVVERETAGAGA